MFNYEEFFSPREVDTYKRVKRGTMLIGTCARQIAVKMVGGEFDTRNGDKEFIRTSKGLFCLIIAHNSLNTTERWATEQMGAEIVVMGDGDEMDAWLVQHGLPRGSFKRFYARTKTRIQARL